jgi:hypothetical protein
LFGTDYPLSPLTVHEEYLEAFQNSTALSDRQFDAITENTLRVFPSLTERLSGSAMGTTVA